MLFFILTLYKIVLLWNVLHVFSGFLKNEFFIISKNELAPH
jgi:hypothetical protein